VKLLANIAGKVNNVAIDAMTLLKEVSARGGLTDSEKERYNALEAAMLGDGSPQPISKVDVVEPLPEPGDEIGMLRLRKRVAEEMGVPVDSVRLFTSLEEAEAFMASQDAPTKPH